MGEIFLDGITKVYANGVRAVQAVELTVAQGEFMVLVGPSGCGKSTLLRMIAGLERVTEGRILIDGADVTDIQPRLRDIAMVFQDYALYPQMNVRENLGFGLKLRRLPKDERNRRVEEVARVLDLSDLLDRKPGALSGGQRQRVAMGRAVVREPAAFLMDEPLSNLDAKLRAQTRGEIRRLQREVGTTTVYVTHDQVEAMTMGDRIAVMSGGRIEQVDDPEAVYTRPANVFVAGFIGSPAMALVKMEKSADGTLARGELRLQLGAGGLDGLPGELVLGARPEGCVPWADGAGLLGPVTGRIEYVEALGRETFVGLECGHDARFVVEADGNVRLTPGEQFRFGLRRRGLHLFDAASGERLSTLEHR